MWVRIVNNIMGPTGFEPVVDVIRRVKSPLRSASTLTIPAMSIDAWRAPRVWTYLQATY